MSDASQVCSRMTRVVVPGPSTIQTGLLCSFAFFWCFSNSRLSNLQESEVAKEATIQGAKDNLEYELWWYSSYTIEVCFSIGKKIAV